MELYKRFKVRRLLKKGGHITRVTKVSYSTEWDDLQTIIYGVIVDNSAKYGIALDATIYIGYKSGDDYLRNLYTLKIKLRKK